ncbi:MAG: Rrf2 family transcriptional regulator [Clostridiales bacterium]|nr:Rrf2 family transcriptional regulator [Clostridiales bacterium]
MKISTKGRYAIRLMLDIAQHSSGENVSLKDVSRRQDISLKYLEQIVNTLCKAGYLRSQRGAQGGYRMTKRPEEYTVGDILRVTEGGLAPVACLEEGSESCPREKGCPMIGFWSGLYQTINKYLDSTTIADLMNNSSDDNFCYYI